MNAERTHFVYRLFREDGLLFYVGYTGNLRRRMREHDRQWYGSQISYVQVEAFDSEWSARIRETRVINALQPPWNLTWRRSA